MGQRQKDKVAAGLFGIFLGSIGLHHFYLGSPGTALIELGLCIVTCGLGALVGIGEGIMLLVMSDEEFHARYVARQPETVEFVFMKPRIAAPPAEPPPGTE